jgi:hypothetical protein
MSEGATYWLRLPDGSQFGPGTMEVVVRWAQEGRVPGEAVMVPTDGGAERAVREVPELMRIIQAPPMVRGPIPQPDAPMSGMIPYRNPPALIGYYLGVFSLVPFLGLLLGPAALICGAVGFRKGLLHPSSKGKVHAWVAIILGAITSIGNWGLMILAIVASRSRW